MERPKNVKMKNIKSIIQDGVEQGYNLASWIDIPEKGQTVPKDIDWVGIGVIETTEDRQEAFMALCVDSEDQRRAFSPFEFTAHELNSHKDPESAWEAYETGLQLGFEKNYSERVAVLKNNYFRQVATGGAA